MKTTEKLLKKFENAIFGLTLVTVIFAIFLACQVPDNPITFSMIALTVLVLTIFFIFLGYTTNCRPDYKLIPGQKYKLIKIIKEKKAVVLMDFGPGSMANIFYNVSFEGKLSPKDEGAIYISLEKPGKEDVVLVKYTG